MKIYCISYGYDYEGRQLVGIADSFDKAIDLYNNSLNASSTADDIEIEERQFNSDMVYKIWRSWPPKHSENPLPKNEGWELIWENKAADVMENFK